MTLNCSVHRNALENLMQKSQLQVRAFSGTAVSREASGKVCQLATIHENYPLTEPRGCVLILSREHATDVSNCCMLVQCHESNGSASDAMVQVFLRPIPYGNCFLQWTLLPRRLRKQHSTKDLSNKRLAMTAATKSNEKRFV